MNYDHAFHAGNFADCMKHALLVEALHAFRRKPKPFFVLDTHAGAGKYDLSSVPAQRSLEWSSGIARLLDHPPAILRDYVRLVKELGLYPGSPVLIRSLLRADDHLACCEMHSDTYRILRALFLGDQQVSVHRRNGYEALKALLPPPQRRALVLVDPPFEAPGEFDRVLKGLREAHRRLAQAVVLAWYPIKHRAPVRTFHAALQASGLRDILALELLLQEPIEPEILSGCGIIALNPPYGFEQRSAQILSALLSCLAPGSHSRRINVVRLAEE